MVNINGLNTIYQWFPPIVPSLQEEADALPPLPRLRRQHAMNRGFEAAVGPALQIHHQGTWQGVHIHPNLRKKHGKMVGTLSNKNVKWWEHGEKWRKWRNIGGTWSKNCWKWWDNAGNMEQTWWKIYNGKLWNTVKNDGIGLNGKIVGLSPSSKNMEFLIWQEWNLISPNDGFKMV